MAIAGNGPGGLERSDSLTAPASAHGEERRRVGASEQSAPESSHAYLSFSEALAAFATAWEDGRTTTVDEFVDRLDPDDREGAVELIYREFCLVEAAGWKADPAHYLERFPRHREALARLLQLHDECTPSLLGRWVDCAPAEHNLPAVGDAVGPFVLRRELGRGSFARVFLAAQTNLENRLVVVKVSTRMTREPWLLARVRHAHIVEIVSHAPVDDGALHLICMPFWGGATLAAVLAAGRARPRPPSSGRDLLADLDAVAAPEFPAVHPARPAREVLSALSYTQALAWVGARLAEALDFAFSRDVAHGDVKPSNILLSADGNPMLLDFNLARDGSPLSPEGGAGDAGGTLGYMAPERLAALAADDWPADDDRALQSTICDESSLSWQPPANHGAGPSLLDPAAHRADLYSLGMVLLEAFTGVQQSRPAAGAGSARKSARRGTAAAPVLAAAGGGETALRLIEHAEVAGGRCLPPGLRVILARCLDPNPEERYPWGRELADDLDRWRTDRPLAFVPEPFWGHTLPRKLRRGRRVLWAAALSLVVAAAATALAVLHSHQTLASIAVYKLARLFDDPAAYPLRRSSKDWQQHPQRTLVSFRAASPSLPQGAENPLRVLSSYDVLGADDWRGRDDVRLLPAADRDDLELWVLEQAFRYCRTLADRPDSPTDWQRARDILDHVAASRPIEAFALLGRRLSEQMAADLDPGARRQK